MYTRTQMHVETSLAEQQDNHIEELTEIAQHLKYAGRTMNQQLKQQKAHAAQLDQQMDLTTGKLNAVQTKLGNLLETNDAGQICTCMMMAGMTIVFSLCLIII